MLDRFLERRNGENRIIMMNKFDIVGESSADAKAAWVKPTLERLSLKEALGGGTTTADGPTVDGVTPFS
jgi:hypothetical protein